VGNNVKQKKKRQKKGTKKEVWWGQKRRDKVTKIADQGEASVVNGGNQRCPNRTTKGHTRMGEKKCTSRKIPANRPDLHNARGRVKLTERAGEY